MLKFILLITVLFASSINCFSNSSYDAMKKGISPFNEAGNMFFNLIRGDVNPDLIKYEDFQNITFSLEWVKKVTSNYLSHSILFAIGITFAVLLPIVGIVFCLCRCCGRCGGKVKPMDPKFVRCKRIVFSICLITLTVGMIFAVIITLFNNQLVHESIVNSDQSINIFSNLQSQFGKMKTNLETMKSEILQSDSSPIEDEHLQTTFKEMKDAIKKFFDNLMNVSEVKDLIEQSKTVKQAFDQSEKNIDQNFLKSINQKLKNLMTELSRVKDNITQKLSKCNTPECSEANKKCASLNIKSVDENKINQIIDMLNSLNSSNFQERLNTMITMKNNGTVDLILILEGEIKSFKKIINNKTFSGNVKMILIQVINQSLELADKVIQNIPSPTEDNSNNYRSFQNTKLYETKRYYVYIAISFAILLIIIFNFMGLLFGNCGERPVEEAGCFNRGVGANFLMLSIVLAFLFSSVIMIVVLAHLLTTNIIQTDFCRYFAVSKENTANNFKLMDRYLELTLKLSTKDANPPDGVMEALFSKCEKLNFYLAFQKITEKYTSDYLKNQFAIIDDRIVTNIANQFNLTKYLDVDPFSNISEISRVSNSLNMSMSNESMTTFLQDLSKLPINLDAEISSIKSIVSDISEIRTYLLKIYENFLNIQKQYNNWKISVVTFNNNIISIIKLHSPTILSSIEKNILSVLNVLFGTMFSKVSCSHIRKGLIDMLQVTCVNVIDPINGCWYGVGIFLLLVVPAMIFAGLLISLYRRIHKFFPDKEEPDYENYIGFYARADGDAMKKNTNQSKQPHRGYKPIPLQ